MKWDDFVRQRKVKKTIVDREKAKSLVLMSKEVISLFDSIKITESTASSVASNYYEALREVVEAVTLLHGWNVYSHEAFTAFLNEIVSEELISRKFDRFRKIRNRINYYGKKVSPKECEELKRDAHFLINLLSKKYL